MKSFLYAFAMTLLFASVFLIFDWYRSEPSNKEPLPALLSVIATIALGIVAWRYDGSSSGTPSSSNTITVTGSNNQTLQDVSNSNIQIHNGTGDNVNGDKKTYNINRIDNADFS